MKLTKYGHACVFLESDKGMRLVVDPGNLTELPDDLSNIETVVITHTHGDHTDAGNIAKIVAANPDVIVYANPETLEALAAVEFNSIAVDTDMGFDFDDAEVSLYFLDHAVVWQNAPCNNLAIKVGDFFYYPGDSFHVIPDHVQVIGVPIVAPWSKLSESIQFVHDINCDQIFPTHNGILNDAGHGIYNGALDNFTKESGKKLTLLKNGESIATK